MVSGGVDHREMRSDACLAGLGLSITKSMTACHVCARSLRTGQLLSTAPRSSLATGGTTFRRFRSRCLTRVHPDRMMLARLQGEEQYKAFLLYAGP